MALLEEAIMVVQNSGLFFLCVHTCVFVKNYPVKLETHMWSFYCVISSTLHAYI